MIQNVTELYPDDSGSMERDSAPRSIPPNRMLLNTVIAAALHPNNNPAKRIGTMKAPNSGAFTPPAVITAMAMTRKIPNANILDAA